MLLFFIYVTCPPYIPLGVPCVDDNLQFIKHFDHANAHLLEQLGLYRSDQIMQFIPWLMVPSLPLRAEEEETTVEYVL